MENVQELPFLGYCLSESLRIEPPVRYSSTVCLTEDLEICGVKIKKGEQLEIDMGNLHRNPREYQQPNEYIPDRFDPSSPYYLTSAGKKRNTMSYMPFLGGKRVCLGKTFAEMSSKMAAATILNTFDFEFVNPDHKVTKPRNDFFNLKEPEVFLKI
jgi:cytochrome P450